ncbi:taurine ABC transporter permease [Pseudomonas sp. PIC25]|uniref:taurine ABC transporter permease TauC n=1 Tax=Pseudomonas sp. PIC25 TaxID=1958773 RepID=UPI000BAB935C|nr:taurine ABC transporter permease TauC [Pseudomonas sp. PIC25]PAU66259.1 taurine ABC transporter permease [Pseudomonas sp. PIC25]
MNSLDLDLPLASPQPRQRPRWRPGIGLLGGLTLGGLFVIWWAVTAGGLIEPLFLPSPAAVVGRFWQLATVGYLDATLWQHLGASLGRIGLGLLAALLTAIPVGIAMGRNRIARGLLDPLIEFYRPIPPLAYLPLIVIWCGIGELSKVLLIYLAIFAPVAIATANAVHNVDPARLRAAQSLGATPAQLVRHVILPSALPDILTGLRIGLGVGWSTLVAAELVAATRGLGFMVQSAAQFLVTDVVVLGILVIALVAFALELGLRRLQRILVPWHGQGH